MRSTHFFELAQQPVAVTLSATEPITVFYIKVPMAYGRFGTAAPPPAQSAEGAPPTYEKN